MEEVHVYIADKRKAYMPKYRIYSRSPQNHKRFMRKLQTYKNGFRQYNLINYNFEDAYKFVRIRQISGTTIKGFYKGDYMPTEKETGEYTMWDILQVLIYNTHPFRRNLGGSLGEFAKEICDEYELEVSKSHENYCRGKPYVILWETSRYEYD